TPPPQYGNSFAYQAIGTQQQQVSSSMPTYYSQNNPTQNTFNVMRNLTTTQIQGVNVNECATQWRGSQSTWITLSQRFSGLQRDALPLGQGTASKVFSVQCPKFNILRV